MANLIIVKVPVILLIFIYSGYLNVFSWVTGIHFWLILLFTCPKKCVIKTINKQIVRKNCLHLKIHISQIYNFRGWLPDLKINHDFWPSYLQIFVYLKLFYCSSFFYKKSNISHFTFLLKHLIFSFMVLPRLKLPFGDLHIVNFIKKL